MSIQTREAWRSCLSASERRATGAAGVPVMHALLGAGAARQARPLTLALAVLFLLVLPSVALAARPSTSEEHASLAAAFDLPPECVTSEVSTADQTWATMRLTNEGDCPMGNGVVVFSGSVAGGWSEVWQGSDDGQPCPFGEGVPEPVALDLGLCVAISPRLYVPQFGKLHYKPRRLGQGAHGVYMRLRWRGWGRSKTVARGVLDYADAYEHFRVPVRLTLSRPGRCGFKRAYRRMSMRPVRAADRRKLRAISGAFRLSCA